MTEETQILSPQSNTRLIGHEAAEAVLLRGLEEGKLAHGWILSGAEGIGKATLAYRFARRLLSGKSNLSEDDPVFRRIIAGSHSDLLVVEPLYDAKKEEYARDISVEQARGIAQFLSMTPGESQWRVVIVDSIDALNANAANAILKTLEEPPPQTVLLLISHNPGRLLPTIRSRCRMLRLTPPDDDQFIEVMRHASPEVAGDERRVLAQLSNYCPGVALKLYEQGALELYEDIVVLLGALPSINMLTLQSFAERIGTGTVHSNWRLFSHLMSIMLSRAAIQAADMKMEYVSRDEEGALRGLAELHTAEVWACKWQQAMDQFFVAQRLHLDYKQVVITFIHSLIQKESAAA